MVNIQFIDQSNFEMVATHFNIQFIDQLNFETMRDPFQYSIYWSIEFRFDAGPISIFNLLINWISIRCGTHFNIQFIDQSNFDSAAIRFQLVNTSISSSVSSSPSAVGALSGVGCRVLSGVVGCCRVLSGWDEVYTLVRPVGCCRVLIPLSFCYHL